VRFVQFDIDNLCLRFGQPERPAFCGGLQLPSEMCGPERDYTMRWLDELEQATAPDIEGDPMLM
jgi:hypothetical protein